MIAYYIRRFDANIIRSITLFSRKCEHTTVLVASSWRLCTSLHRDVDANVLPGSEHWVRNDATYRQNTKRETSLYNELRTYLSSTLNLCTLIHVEWGTSEVYAFLPFGLFASRSRLNSFTSTSPHAIPLRETIDS